MKQLSIKYKLLAAFLAVATLTAIVGGMGVFGLLTLNNNKDHLYQTGVHGTYAVRLAANISAQEAVYTEAVLYMNDRARQQQSLDRLSQLEVEFDDNLATLEADELPPQLAQYLAQIKTTYYGSFRVLKQTLTSSLDSHNQSLVVPMIRELDNQTWALTETINQFSIEAFAESQRTNLSDSQIAAGLTALMAGLAVFSVLLAVFLGLYITRLIARPLRRITDAAQRLAEGELELDVQVDSRDEVGALSRSFQAMIESFRQYANTAIEISQGNFNVSFPVRGERDVMSHALNQALEADNRLYFAIRNASRLVSQGSRQIAVGSQSLAAGSSEQASSLEEFSAVLTGLKEQIRTNAGDSQMAQSSNQQTHLLVEKSIETMEELREAMVCIDESYRGITKVSKAISEISFQTNLLALNASVEAAGAGQHGKGFAVVADEVRRLARRSGSCVEETGALIEGCASRVELGHQLVEQTRQSLLAVAENVQHNLDLATNVADASAVQADRIEELYTGVEQISAVVQANSATAQQAAASAQEMAVQASLLGDLLKGVVVREPDGEEQNQQPQQQPAASTQDLSYHSAFSLSYSSEDKY